MTERLYYTSDALECTARLKSCTEQADGRYAVVLDRTLFHPQGGGQPADAGFINDIKVESVIQQEDDVIHLLAQPLAAEEVTLKIEADSRALHSQLHSAGHMIGYAGEQYGWQPVKAHHWPGEGRITFNAGENAILPESEAILALINSWKAAALARIVEFKAGRRNVRFGELPAYGCGGTHIPTLAALGEVVISNIKIKKGQLIIHYSVQ
ncbi:serine-tRNA(Ala) deacylase AlaX [Enterobacter sp. Bisph1]|uniref:serine-tRNA(Ala) deacylase AlaX n=1 Tax=Enterobacter sp. Bisph1 TaxID=1274399 RepID=UPI00057BEF34|nr:serine-tRNA(Ala) deacylase AlaX [Enterobacter sp. Bisph1]